MKECAKLFIEFLKSNGVNVKVDETDKKIIVGFITVIEENKAFITIVFDEEDYKILYQGSNFVPKIEEKRRPYAYEIINHANNSGINYKYVVIDDEIVIQGYYLIRELDNFNVNMANRTVISMIQRIQSDYQLLQKIY